MKLIDRLETTIHSLIEVNERLRKERDKKYKVSEHLKKELKTANETIKELHLNIEKMSETSESYRELKTRKREIIDHIKSILFRLDQFDNIGKVTITNEEGKSSLQ